MCDEDKYIKILSYDDVNKKFKIEKEFFVNNNFATTDDLNILENYSYSNGMLYNNSECYLLQERGTERVDTDTAISDVNNMFKDGAPSFPLCSSDFVLRLLNPRDSYDSSQKAPFFLYLSPPLNSHKSKNGPAYGNDIEFFSHSDPRKIIRLKRDYYSNKITAELCHLNGLVLNSQQIDATGAYIEPFVSRNGRFLCSIGTGQGGKFVSKVYDVGTLNSSETHSDNP